MKYALKILLSLIFLAICGKDFAQGLSNRGRDFWVGYGHHQFMEPGQPNSQEMVLYLSAEQAANVTVTIDGTTWVRNYAVPANTVIASEFIPKAGTIDARLISLPCSFVPPGSPCGGEGIFTNKAIHIVSDVPIVAYAHIFGSASSGASMLMPVETWGYNYVTLNSKQNYATNCFSWVYAIAQHDNTVIEVTPASITRSLKPANTPFTVTLMKGQIYQAMAGPETGSTKPEMTGTKIKSIANALGDCYPIAVFAGSSRTTNPMACGSGGGDNDNQQCFPSQAWGKRYLTSPTSFSTNPTISMSNGYKIAVKDPTTIVKRNGVTLTPLANGTYYFESNTADYIQADKPIMVAQFMSGGACMGGIPNVGDPEMMYISPIEQGIKRIGFYRNDRQSINFNYLTLIIPTAGVSSLIIDGSATFNYSYPHPNLTGYTVVVKRWGAGQAQATAQSDSAFTAITYGLGNVESYGYNAGTLINNLNAVGSIFNTSDTSAVTSHPFTCTNTPVKLSVLLGYPTPPSRIVWQLSQVGGGLSPNTDVIDNAPVPVGTQVINGITYFKFELAGTYTFTTTGNYSVPILATHPTVENCSNTEGLFFIVEVRGKPVADFSFTHTGCVLDSVYFSGITPSSNGFNINQWLYTFPDATTSNTRITSKLFTTTGPKNVRLNVVSTEGCISDTTKQVIIYPKPTVSFTVAPLAVCQGSSLTFTGTSNYTGPAPITSWYWDFGDGNVVTAPANTPQTHTYATYGSYTVKYTANVSALCMADTFSRVVQVYALPTTSFTYPAGCLPASGTVQFTSTATTPDGQAVTGHSWNFGDPGSGPLNTSTLPNPTHTYPGFGTYTVTYSTTTANGCTKDTTVIATFNLAPTFNYPVLAPVCQNVPAPISVATATVTNGVPGSGIYNGPGTTSAGIFNPAVAGPGTHTIWFVYTTNANCIDSVSQTITVNPTPSAAFSIPNAGCLPVSGIVNFTYTGTALPGQTYLWNFGDPGSGGNNTSTLANPSHNYPTTGTYTISLTITSGFGCVKDSVVTQTFNVTPALNYPALAPVCESAPGTISVATATVTNGVTGTGVYSGPGTNAAGNFNPSVAGPGTHTITYTFTSSGNCVATITQTITVNAKPAANFTYPTVACLPTTGLAQFTYTGSLSAGQTYLWNFGDPASGGNNTSTLQNPTHNYTNTGSYTVTVTVTNSNGCVDTKTITATFSVTPALNYPALAPVCESVPGTISVATATVTNGVTGTGVYSGPGTDAAGNFNPTVAGPGSHTITYTFTSTGNCVATITQTVTVSAKPAANFSYPTVACLPTTGLAQFTYTGSMSAGQTYLWNFGDPASGGNNTSILQNPTHIYTNTGSYTVTVTVTNSNGCVDTKTITTTFSVTPALNYPALTPVCESVVGTISVASATVTNGVAGTGVYSGPGTDAAGNFNPTVAGPGTHTITYTFTSTGNCIATITQTITVSAKPNASFSIANAGCLPASGIVNFTYTGTALPGQTYLWNFGDPASGGNNTSTLANPSHNYTTGTYTISLTVTSSFGCVKDSVITQTFNVTPALNYPALAPVCESVVGTISVASATVTNGVAGTGVYSGPGTDAAGNFNPSVAGPGTHTITYTFTSTGNCVATITQTITVSAKPAANFSYPTVACLPTTGLAQFTYTGSISVGQTYLWNFGDPASGGNNTSTLQNPTHNYTNTGSYTITVTVTNSNGCVDTKTITTTFSVTPALSYPALTGVCESVTGTVSVATATVTNGVAGTGVYSGPGTDAAGNFNPSVAGPGTHTLTYTFTSTGNCVATITQTIIVNAKPAADFSYPTTACLPITGLAQFTYTGSMSAGQTYLWNFGDPASGGNNTSTLQNPTHNYTNTGSYTVTVTVTNSNGCVDTKTITTTFSVTPALNYPALVGGCENVVGTISVATATVTNGVAGTGVYSGPGTDAAGNFNPSVAGPGTHTITYTFTSTGNCVATITQTITVNAKPQSSFNITASVCQGQTANINAIVTGGSIVSWHWFYGDGNSDVFTNSNPFTKLYPATGTYVVKLITVNASGCISDTARQTVTVSAVPVSSFDVPTSVCMPGGMVSFTNRSTVADGSSLTYSWNFDDGSPNSSAINPTHVYASIRTYNISLRTTSSSGCFKDTIIPFSAFFDKPIARFGVSPDVLCQGTENVFSDSSSAPNSTIKSRLWIFGDGTTSTSTNPTKTYSKPGIYQVKLVVTNNENCISDTFRQTITVYLQPVIDAGPSFVVPLGTTIQFKPTANDSTVTSFVWYPATGLSNPLTLRPVLTATTDQVYTLTATVGGKCIATDSLYVKILRPIKVPNAFSPNGDGTNDTWIIDNLVDYPGARVEVFNRYGQLLYSSIGYSNPWDGTIKGKPLPLATYYYIITLNNGFKPLNGSITIIR